MYKDIGKKGRGRYYYRLGLNIQDLYKTTYIPY
jgi:hypothetical protein